MLLSSKSRTLKLAQKLVNASRFASNPLFLFKSRSSTCTETIEQAKEEEKKEQTQDLFLHDISRTMSTDLNDYKIIKEGEAEILMHSKNEAFYNKALVNNRDISIAVLRTFISKRKQEHEAYLSKRTKGAQKASENDSSELVMEEIDHKTPPEDHKSIGECELEQEISPEEPCSTMEGSVMINEECDASKDKIDHLEGKGQRELKPPRVLEALSALGLRALRYAREVEGIGQVVALDNDKASVEACRRNIKFNGSVAVAKVESHLADARVYMLTHPKEFDVVDLDPYGSPSVFLDSAVQSVADGGILMCTATDMAVLCGGNGEVCYSKYGSYPLRGKYCHEMALRIVLASIESHANRYKRYIVPVLSVQMDFYLRVFVRVYTSANAMKNTPLKLSYVYQCTGCDSFHLQPIGRTISKNTSVRYLPGHGPVVPQECSDCGKKFNMGGPIWSAPIHDQEWVTSILADVKRMKDSYPAFDRISAVLTTISEELPDVPLYLSLHNLCSTLKCTSPSTIIFRSAVINAGYRISGTHVNPLGLKSDAPMDVIWDIMRCWVKNHTVKAQPADQPGSIILAKEPVLQVKNHPVKAQPADEPGSILAKEPVLQIIKEAANIASTGIAFDPVTRDNYLDWSTCVKGHLVGQDLWNNVVEGDLDVNYPNWKSKDAQALHAIRFACGYQARVRIQKCKTAKEAWSNLNVIFNKDLIANIDVIEEECPQNDVDRLHQAINKGLWDRASSIIRDAPNIICKQSPSTGYTALHVAVSVGNKRIMRELVAKDRASLTEKDTRGYTPLALVASKSIEEKNIAEWLVTEGGIDMLDMEIEAAEGPGKGDIPVLLAAANGHKEITRYLFFKANWVWYSLFNNNCFYADKLLRHCIHAEIFDVAAALLKYNPLLRHTFDTQLSLCYMKPIYELACKPTVFPSGTRLNPFQHIIYKVLLVPMQMEIEGKRESNTNLAAKICKFMRSLAGAITGFLIKLPGIKKIYETKINHYLVNEILKSFCERIKKIPSQSKLHQLSVQDAMLQAAKNGIVEFIRSMGKANPDLLRVVDTNKRGIMAHAILNRQKEVFNLIYEIRDRTELITPIDVIGNNLLHLAADLGLSPSHDHGSNAALEMQKEHQLFKEVESNVPPMYKEAKNSYDIKPGELFTTSHKQLVKDGCEWAKGRPAPFIVIGTFIMTFSIGTAFRMHEEPFSYVMVAIALSFITSLTSVLAFTSIITSSYAEKDFIKSLPITFFFGVVNNFLSLVFLVWAFGAILSVELKEHVWMAIAGITYVFIGVVMFMCSLWPYVNSICLLLPRCLRRVLYVAN